MSRLPHLLFLLLLVASTAAGARMYEWQDPISGSVQFSGEPPSWYRSPEGGPRVRVYDGGKLVDDTSIALSAEDNRSMRELAIGELREEQQLAAIKRLERTARREESRREQERREAAKAEAEAEQSDTSEAPPEVLPESLDAEEVKRLKDILAEFDRTSGGSTIGPPAQEIFPGSVSGY